MLETASWFRMGACVHVPSRHWDPVWLELCLCEFLQTSVLVCLENTVCLASFNPLVLTFLSPPFPHSSLSPEGRIWWRYSTPRGSQCSKVPHSLHTFKLWISVSVVNYQRRTLLRWWLSDTLITWQNLSRNHYFIMFLSKNNSIWFPFGPWPLWSQVLGHPKQCRSGFHLMEWVLRLIRLKLLTPSVVALLHQRHSGWSLSRGRVSNWVGVSLSPLLALQSHED